jgi:hypothetical protein
LLSCNARNRCDQLLHFLVKVAATTRLSLRIPSTAV